MWPTIAALVVALAGPPLFVVVPDWLFGANPAFAIQVLLQLAYCGMAAGLLWYVVGVERRPLASIGLRSPDWSTWVTAAVALVVVIYVVPMITAPLTRGIRPPGLEAGLLRLAVMPVWFRIVIGVTGGIVEEILYRGFAIERLAILTRSRAIGATISVIAFALAHVPMWGLTFALTADLPFGIFMTALYLWRRDLPANILTHSGALVIELLAPV